MCVWVCLCVCVWGGGKVGVRARAGICWEDDEGRARVQTKVGLCATASPDLWKIPCQSCARRGGLGDGVGGGGGWLFEGGEVLLSGSQQ